MKRASYVDKEGNAVDQTFESKKPILNIFFIVGTIVPIILVGLIIYTMCVNNGCNKQYKSIKEASLRYIKENNKVPELEGEVVKVNINTLYSKHYLSELRMNGVKCSGTVKMTKYKKGYIYTLNVSNCNSCDTAKKYGSWSELTSRYPKNKSIIDVVPYYNYYGRQVNTTGWSDYYEQNELEDEKSKYGVKLPIDESKMPTVPKDGNIVDIKKQEKTYYQYSDLQWRWYDIVGDYSDYSSEQPAGYANKDEDTEMQTEWSEYSKNYPEEKDYREIISVTGYKFYYVKNGKKHYANNGDFIPQEEVDTEKYDQRDDEETTLYHYRDTVWRWYNGEERSYSSYRSSQPSDYPYKDEETEISTGESSWSEESSLDSSNIAYRTEVQKVKVRYAYVYEFLTKAYLNKPVTKQEFENTVNMSAVEFSKLENYKLEITYKFKYRKS